MPSIKLYQGEVTTTDIRLQEVVDDTPAPDPPVTPAPTYIFLYTPSNPLTTEVKTDTPLDLSLYQVESTPTDIKLREVTSTEYHYYSSITTVDIVLRDPIFAALPGDITGNCSISIDVDLLGDGSINYPSTGELELGSDINSDGHVNYPSDGNVDIELSILATDAPSAYCVGYIDIDCDIYAATIEICAVGNAAIIIHDIGVLGFTGAYGNAETEISLNATGSSDFLGSGSCSIQTTCRATGTVGFVASGEVELSLSVVSVGSGPISAYGAVEFTLNRIRGTASGMDWLGMVLRYDDRWIIDSSGYVIVKLELLVVGEE